MGDNEAYQTLIRTMEMKPSSYKEIANDWEENEKEWYHALIAIEDLPTVLAI